MEMKWNSNIYNLLQSVISIIGNIIKYKTMKF